MGNFMQEIGTIATAIIGLAIVAVLVSNQARTAGVIQSAGDSFANALRAATSPYSQSGFGAASLPGTFRG